VPVPFFDKRGTQLGTGSIQEEVLMPAEIIAALIALTGVIVSVLLSYRTTVHQTNLEVSKYHEEVLQGFGAKLFEKRLEAYPILYSYLSKFIKVIEFGVPSKADIDELVCNMQDWDTHYAILFSAVTGRVSYETRKTAIQLGQMSPEALKQWASCTTELQATKHKLAELEIALKNELGIYTFESPTQMDVLKKYQSYAEASVSTVSDGVERKNQRKSTLTSRFRRNKTGRL
jgi:hypothetical protein